MSCGNKLSNVWTSVLWSEEGITSFNKNNRVNFSGYKKLKWSFSWCPFWEYIDYEFLVLRAKRTRHENDRARALPLLNLKKKRDCSQSREIHEKKASSQIDLLLAVVLVLQSEGLYLCTEEEGFLALALVTYLRAFYLDKAYLGMWCMELELRQYNDLALDLSRCAFLWGFL